MGLPFPFRRVCADRRTALPNDTKLARRRVILLTAYCLACHLSVPVRSPFYPNSRGGSQTSAYSANRVVHTANVIKPEVISPEDADVAAYIIPPPPEFTDFLEHADVADYIIPPPPEFVDSLEHTDVNDDILHPPPEFVDSLEYADVGDHIIPPPPEFADFPEPGDSMHYSPVVQTADRLLENATDNDYLPQLGRLVQSKPRVTGTKNFGEPVTKFTTDPNAVENYVTETINPAISAVERPQWIQLLQALHSRHSHHVKNKK